MLKQGLMLLGVLAAGAWSSTAHAEFDEWPFKSWSFNDVNTNNALNQTPDSDFFAGRVPAGTVITVSTCGTNNGTDTVVRLFSNTRGIFIGGDDDGCGYIGGGSQMVFKMTKSEDITVRVGCYNALACNGTVRVGSDVSVAQRWAPVIYHDTHSSAYADHNTKQDQISKIDFDGDFIATNNRMNTTTARHEGWVYYSFVRTSTERYVSYYFFHSDDVAHENDLEGVQFLIKDDGTFYGIPFVMQAERHGGIYFYSNQPGITGLSSGGIRFEPDRLMKYVDDHPRIYIEYGGHGVHTCGTFCDIAPPAGDGFIYRFKVIPEAPGENGTSTGTTNWDIATAVGYQLRGLSDGGDYRSASPTTQPIGLFALRFNPHIMLNPAFADVSNGKIKPGSATIPFASQSSNGWGGYGRWVCHPAWQFDGNLSGLGVDNLNRTYTQNFYAQTGVDLGTGTGSKCKHQ